MRLSLTALIIYPLAATAGSSQPLEAEVNRLNAQNLTWTAGINAKFTGDDYLEIARGLMGVSRKPTNFSLPIKAVSIASSLPSSWSSIEEFPECPSLADIWDQSACASCYVMSTVMSAADRVCIATKGKFTARLSAEHMLSCCKTCGFGCAEGFPPYAWKWLETNGIVTGGDYQNYNYCSSYSLAPCEHHSTGQYPDCGNPLKTPTCPTACDAESKYPISFDQDLVKFKRSYQLPTDDESIMTEIMQHGSVGAEMNVYGDFLTYKSGVYQATSGEDLGGHAVRILGWGTESSKPYWLVANSWNRDWGDKGYFKIVRGNCGINRGVYGAEY